MVMEDAAAGVEAAKAGDMAAIGIARADDADLLAEAGADIVPTTLDQVDLTATSSCSGTTLTTSPARRPTLTATGWPSTDTVRCARLSSQRTTARTRTPKSLRHLRPFPARSSYAAVASAVALVSATGVLPVARLLSAQADCGSWCRDSVIRSRGGAPRRPASGAAGVRDLAPDSRDALNW